MRDRTICRQDAGSTFKPPLNRYPAGRYTGLINGNGIRWRRNFRGHKFGSPQSGLNSLACTLRDQGKLAEAEAMLREALASCRKMAGDGNQELRICGASLMDVLMRERKVDEAERLVNELLAPSGNGEPERADLLRIRANFFARQGQWKEAIADLQRAIALAPMNHWFYHALAPLLLQSGDLDGYRKHCQLELAQFRDTKDPNISERMALDCLILQDSGVDLAATAVWADTAVAGATNLPNSSFRMCAKSFAEYRQRRFASAAEWMQKARSCPKSSGGETLNACLDVRSYAGLAMAHYRLKQADEARTTWAKAVEIANTKLPKPDSIDLGAGWVDWIIANALMSEARALIDNPNASDETK